MNQIEVQTRMKFTTSRRLARHDSVGAKSVGERARAVVFAI